MIETYEKIIPKTTAEWIAEREAAKFLPPPKLERRKVSVPEKPFVHRVGYHSVVSNYTGGNTVNRLSGSSINRKKRDNEKADRPECECRGIAHAIGEVRRSAGKTEALPAWVCPGLLSPAQVADIRNRKRLSDTAGKQLPRVHLLNGRSKGIVKARCTAFYRACVGRKTLCTLTFINDVADTAAVRILNKFLTVLRKEFSKLQYIWVAERQEKTTKRIHFHIIVNVFMPIKRWNALWVLQQYNAGITHPKFTRDEVLNFINMEMTDVLNPVDVTRVKNVKHLSIYLTKYITKGDNKEGFGCLAWHCSREVSKLFLRTICDWTVVQLAKSIENARFDRRTGEFFGMPEPVREKSGKFFYTIWYLNQPGRFLPFLKEMEEINRYIIAGDVTTERVIQYLVEAYDEDHSRLN
jgi:hypothetical protein